MAYLNNPNEMTVCALYGLKGTGKTTLMFQAIETLIEQGVELDKICYFSGLTRDLFIDVVDYVSYHHLLEYVFIDEIGAFDLFLNNQRDPFHTWADRNKKVVIASSHLLSLYFAYNTELSGISTIVRIPHLSFYEHCHFVLDTENPSEDDFSSYLQTGGLFEPPVDTAQYVQENIVNKILDLLKSETIYFRLQPLAPWFRSVAFETDWSSYINTILAMSNSQISNETFKNLEAFPDNPQTYSEYDSRMVIKEFREYFKLVAPYRQHVRPKKSVTVELLDFLLHCGIIAILPDFNRNEPCRCYVQAPFLRYHFTGRLLATLGDESAITKSSLLKAAIVSEYQLGNPGIQTYYAYVPYKGDPDEHEIVLLVFKKDVGYALKEANDSSSLEFERIGPLLKFRDYRFELLETVDCMNYIYQWGKNLYINQ
jgi:hypothetical protein